MFKFTFSLGTNTLNPFTAQAEERERIQQATAPQTIKRKLPAPPRRPLPSPSPSEEVPRTKKRGWVPTSSSASAAISQPTLTNGWIDTPAKYMAQASESHDNDGDDTDDLPPAKKRKTLTDSVISTAFSAALIGTAVGMTAYRMWRDRGKSAADIKPDHMNQPPPPYVKEEWVDEIKSTTQPPNSLGSRLPRLPKKPRTIARRTVRHRRTPISPARSPARGASPPHFVSSHQEEPREDQGELEDQMDWMGDKIRRLIEEGQKALGKEIVVMNEEQNNEEEGAVDDGMEGWEEEHTDIHAAGPSSVTSSTFHRPLRRPTPLAVNTSASPPAPSYFDLAAAYGSVSTSPRGKRARSSTNGSSQIPSGSRSPYLGMSSATKLGGQTSRADDVKVIYEPGAISPNIGHIARSVQDEDSRRLNEGMDAVRTAYKIH